MKPVYSVSVVVPVLNGASTIGDMLTALVNQAGVPPQTEIIVVDNGSTDGTQDIVRRFDVVLLEESKRGPAAARNRGLCHATGDVVAHLDADTLPTRRWLAELVAPFTDRDVILAGGKTLSYCPVTPAECFMAQLGIFEMEHSVARGIFPFVSSRNMAVRRENALAIEGWAEEMPTAEDMDFCHRLLREFSTEIVLRSAAILFHHERTSDDALQRQSWTYGEGLAQMYLRYPEVVRWDAVKSIRLARTLLIRSAMPAILHLGEMLGLASGERVEFATYHRLWSWWYWRGFFSMYRHKERRAP